MTLVIITMHHLLMPGYSCANSIVFSVITCLHFIVSGLLKDLQTAELQLREPIVKLVLDKVSSGASFIGSSMYGGFAYVYPYNHKKLSVALDICKLYEFHINLMVSLFILIINFMSIGLAEGSNSQASNRDFQNFTVERLRALLKSKGLSPKGKKVSFNTI